MNKKTYIVVGGVAAGASAAARLRRKDEDAHIIVLEKGPFVSFSNCGLPYRISGQIQETENLILMTPELLNSQYGLDVRVNNEVVGIDTGNKTVSVMDTQTGKMLESIEYDALVLAPGAKAIVPGFAKETEMPIFKLKTVPDTAEVMEHLGKGVKHMTVIGGGFIGIESAENLKEAGFDVTLVEGGTQLMNPLDHEMSLYADSELIKHGVEVIKNDLVVELTKDEVVLQSGKRFRTDGVILSIGVLPNTNFLLDTNIELYNDGYIKVNDNFETNIKDIFAAGDAIKVRHAITGEYFPIQLAGPANKQGRLVADRIYGEKIVNRGYLGTSIIKIFDISLGSVGLNEKQLKDTNIDYHVAYAAPPGIVGIMPGKTFVKTKLIFEKNSGKILGAQAVAEYGVDKRIDVIATAMKAGMTVEDLQDLELAYAPTFGTGKDVVNKIGYIANNILKGDFEQVPFTEVYNLLENGEQIFDIREADEYAEGHIKGVPLLPMSEMRDRLEEIDKNKTVYVHCRTGERSYNMTLMLKAKGYDAVNIAGSWMFLESYEKAKKVEDSNRKEIIE